MYDDRGLLVERHWGDGVAQVYKYEDYTQRLSNTYWYSLRDDRTIQDIAYEYDSVGNITRISQGIPDSPFGITNRTYTYDYQYRLVQSQGKSDREYNYELEMMYSPAGRLYRSFSRNDISDYTEIIYGYDHKGLTHQPRVLYIPTHSEHTLQLYWDANGNLCQQKSCYESFGRLHYWDEENRLQMVIDSKYGSYYGYNATGERLYKITGINSSDQLNGGYGVAKIDFDEATLYPFQYLTIKPQYYTKHYFIGNEHIATNFGNGGFEKVTPNTERKPETIHESQLIQWFYNMQWDDPYVFRTNTVGETTRNIDYQGIEHDVLQYQCDPTIVADLYASWRPRLHNIIGNNLDILNKQEEPYFYHNDHLGSTKLVMDTRGRICNEIDYMPFGETFHSDRGHLHLEEHKFTGKERDEETQYDYFGARYYWSAAKHWLTVDPLSDKYPGISPYTYCGWNPINYVDPDGKEKISLLSISSNTSQNLITAYQNYPDYSDILSIWGHGVSQRNNMTMGAHSILYELDSYVIRIANAAQFNQLLMEKSILWQDHNTGEFAVIMLHSCNTGKGIESFAQKMSADSYFENVLIIAPNSNIVISGSKEIGVFNTQLVNGKNVQGNVGEWNYYFNGKLVHQQRGDEQPIHNVQELKRICNYE